MRRCSGCRAHVQKTAGCRQTLHSQLLLELPCRHLTASLQSVSCHRSTKAKDTVREGLSNTGANWRKEVPYTDDLRVPAWVDYILQICITISSSKVCSAWSLYPAVSCCARLWKKHCCNIQSQTWVHSRSRRHYFCAFPSAQTSWACFETDFLFVRDFGDIWLKPTHRSPFPT